LPPAFARVQKQPACRILVAAGEKKITTDQGELWDSGKAAGDETELYDLRSDPDALKAQAR